MFKRIAISAYRMISMLMLLLASLLVFTISSCHAQNPTNDQKEIDIHFSPNEGIQKAIIEELQQADSTVDVAMYIFSNRDLAEALIAHAPKRFTVACLPAELPARPIDSLPQLCSSSDYRSSRDSPATTTQDVAGSAPHHPPSARGALRRLEECLTAAMRESRRTRCSL